MKEIVYGIFVLGALTGIAAPTAATVPCDAEAEALYAQGRQAALENRNAYARDLYGDAAERCDSFKNWMAVGDIWVDRLLGNDIEVVNRSGKQAVEAYNNAFQAARRDQNAVDGAASARAMVNLGLRAGDPIRANEWLRLAEQLDPEYAGLEGLRGEVDAARRDLSTDEIATGFSRTRGIGQAAVTVMSGTQMANSNTWVSQARIPAGPPVVDIPINFAFDSIRLDARTENNIRNLAAVLADSSIVGELIFTGHADERGDGDYNMWLSVERARAIQQQVEILQPTLVGRISTEGRGEEEPKNIGLTERAYAENRRLEVVVRSD